MVLENFKTGRYGFNGKEKLNEFHGNSADAYDYGMRAYDARLGRFMSVDPLFNSYPYYTSYQFAGNKPIQCIDLEGAEEKEENDQAAAANGKSIRLQLLNATTKTYEFVNNKGYSFVFSSAILMQRTYIAFQGNQQLIKEAGYFLIELFNPSIQPVVDDPSASGDELGRATGKALGYALKETSTAFKNILGFTLSKAFSVSTNKNIVAFIEGSSKNAKASFDLMISVLSKQKSLGLKNVTEEVLKKGEKNVGDIIVYEDKNGNYYKFRQGTKSEGGIPTIEISSNAAQEKLEIKFSETGTKPARKKKN